MRRLFLVLPACLVLAPMCAAGIPTDFFMINVPANKGKPIPLVAEDGKATTGNSTFNRVPDRNEAPDRWYIFGSRIKSSVGGGYLAYDPTGKSKRVFLAAKRDGEGTEWDVELKGGNVYTLGVIRAGTGKVKGWGLVVEEATEKRRDGKTVTVQRIILAKDPPGPTTVTRLVENK
jgi:hypothetical protein